MNETQKMRAKWSDKMEIRESDWHPQNFRIMNTEDPFEKGVCNFQRFLTWVSLWKHLRQFDIIDTCTEESVHQAIASETCGIIEDEFDTEEEEWMMEKIFWALEGWILN